MPLGSFRVNSLAKYRVLAVSEGWNLSTAIYDSVSRSIAADDGLPIGLFFKPDGTIMYMLGISNDRVYQYTLSTPWDINSADSVTFRSILNDAPIATDLYFNPDGTRMYISDNLNDRILQYTLSTPWNIVTAGSLVTRSISTQENNPQAIHFKPDGTKMYLAGLFNDTVYQYTLSTPWNINSLTYDNVSFSLANQVSNSNPQGVFFKSDGTRMYVLVDTNDIVYQYTLSTPWDINTATFNSSFSVNSQENSPTAMYFKPDGTKMYIVGFTNDTIYQYSLTS